MVDYPGLLCVTLFTPGCNLRCPFCHNSPLVLGGDADSRIEEEELLEFLKERKGRLDGICITGGEPLLQKDVLPFLEKLKIELDLFNSADFCQRVENLKENYTLDSNEFIDFINQFNEWKNDLHQKLKDFVKNEENQDELFKELSPCEKLTVINIIYINYNIEENQNCNF